MAYFQTKNQNLGNFNGLAIEDISLFCSYFVYFMAIWFSLCLFGVNIPILVCCTKKNLATLDQTSRHENVSITCVRSCVNYLCFIAGLPDGMLSNQKSKFG
jgi:hypothetical protein